MTPREELASEVKRARTLIGKAKTPDEVDVAVVEALASPEVQDKLLPLLEEGATFAGITMETAGTVDGFVQLTFSTTWIPGTLRTPPPSAVIALVKLSPPRVLKAAVVPADATTDPRPIVDTTGPTPVLLQQAPLPKPAEVAEFHLLVNRAYERWLKTSGLEKRLPASGSGGLTSNTHCSGLTCIEHYSDDFD